MNKELQYVCDALALAGCILEQKNREDWCCPYHHQEDPRLWCKAECKTCEYSFAMRPGFPKTAIVSYKPEFRAACWVEYLLWEAGRRKPKGRIVQ
jgi:hypothetical protein